MRSESLSMPLFSAAPVPARNTLQGTAGPPVMVMIERVGLGRLGPSFRNGRVAGREDRLVPARSVEPGHGLLLDCWAADERRRTPAPTAAVTSFGCSHWACAEFAIIYLIKQRALQPSNELGSLQINVARLSGFLVVPPQPDCRSWKCRLTTHSGREKVRERPTTGMRSAAFPQPPASH